MNDYWAEELIKYAPKTEPCSTPDSTSTADLLEPSYSSSGDLLGPSDGSSGDRLESSVGMTEGSIENLENHDRYEICYEHINNEIAKIFLGVREV